MNEQTVCINDDLKYNYAADDYVTINENDSIMIDVTENELRK